MKVLVVEDKPRMSNFLSRALQREGHSVLVAYDGQEALDIERSTDCDVILLDVMLPRVDGFTVIDAALRHGLSISLRLAIWFSTILLVGFAGFGALMWFDMSTYLIQGRDKTLSTRARRLIELMDEPENDSPQRQSSRYRDFTASTPEGKLIQVFTPKGVRALSADGASEFPWPAIPASNADYRTTIESDGHYYRILVRPARIGGLPVRIFVAGQLEDYRMQLQRFTEGLLRAFPFLLIAAGLGGYFVSRRALDPVARLIDSGQSITIGNLSRRLPVSRNGDELARLAETWNAMLARLEAAVNRITRFTADASHELCSPLSIIRMASESTLRHSALDPEVADVFREIVAEAEAASRLLDDLLILARSDAGHIEVVFQPVDLSSVVREVSDKIRVMAQEKRQTLEHRSGAANPSVAGDPQLLRRLAWILIDNAVKYTPQGGRIDVSMSGSGAQVVLQVADSGRGIPADSLPHIFDRFYRVDPARSGEEGTGLGLAIAKWIADAHRAELLVTSIEQKGTTFQVWFPLLPG